MVTGARTARRRFLSAAVAALCAVVLTACGARIDTVLTVAEDGQSGSRVMTLTLDRSDFEDEDLDVSANNLEKSVRSHLPESLELTKFTTTSDQVTATLTLSFASVDEYRQKVAQLLQLAEPDAAPQISIQVEDTMVLKGAHVEESFSSEDLLEWLTVGLVEDGVIDESDAWYAFDDTTNTVKIGETVYEDRYSRMTVDDLVDNGFRSVSMETAARPEGGWTRTITYVTPNEIYSRATSALDPFFAETVAPLGTLEGPSDDGYETQWKLTFSAADDAALADGTNKALGSTESTFAMTTGLSKVSPTTRDVEIVDVVDCSAICSPDASSVSSTLAFPAGLTVSNGHDQPEDLYTEVLPDGSTAVTHAASGERYDGSIWMQREMPLSRIDVMTALERGGKVSQTFTIEARTEDVAESIAEYSAFLDPGSTVGTLTTSTEGASTFFVVRLAAGSASELNSKLSSYLPNSLFSLADESSMFSIDQSLSMSLDLSKLAPGGVTNGAKHTLLLPSLHKINAEESGLAPGTSIDGGTISWPLPVNAWAVQDSDDYHGDDYANSAHLSIEGRTVEGIVVTVVLVLVLVLAAIVAFIRREDLMPMLSRVKNRAAAGVGATVSVGGAAASAFAAANADGGEPGWPVPDDEQPAGSGSPAEFTEADLV